MIKLKKRKAVEDEICEIECKRKLLNKSIQAMSLEADRSAAQVEVKHNFTLFKSQILSDCRFVKVMQIGRSFVTKYVFGKKSCSLLKNIYLCMLKKYHIGSVFKLLMLYHDFLLNFDG